eukprot:TRINITY_DN2845_c2_g1_i1.p1 TRINITY_DN2845_c2_g1~~TRINITY_DN2845_c2_g1_i1.p1  ORF type:complete len:164 (+),score=34.41 TRINITY_DN2845_c2_g1_i1:165-656(+)
MSTTPLGKVEADVPTTTTSSDDVASASTSTINIPAIGLNELPLELVAHIADYAHSHDASHQYRSLHAMILVSHHLRNGVCLSRQWRIVNEVLAEVQDVEERRKILFDRKEASMHASRSGNVRLLRFVQLTPQEAYAVCLPLASQSGHLECVRYLTTEFDCMTC